MAEALATAATDQPSPIRIATPGPLPRCRWVHAGSVSYADGLRLQHDARTMVAAGTCRGVLLTLDHHPVITLGRAGGADNVRRDLLDRNGVLVVEAGRGGNVTCHNPGQLVVYPVLDLAAWRKDVVWYVRMLEEVVIRTLDVFGLSAGRKPGYTGVWLKDEKIAAIGVSVRKWITSHGLALNVDNDLTLFEAIVPCGIREFGVTSMDRAGVAVDPAEVRARLVEAFVAVFPCTLIDDSGAEFLSNPASKDWFCDPGE
jgi:lipoyl(octanoyl) transferase